MHFANQRNGVGDTFVPARHLPSVLASFFPLLVRLVAPHVVNIVQATDLREESTVSLIVDAAKVDGTSPVVAPFNHRSRLQAISTQLVDVVALPWRHHWPVAESEQILQVPCSQKSAAFSC